MNCKANPACPFPPVRGKLCREHNMDRMAVLTFHEMSGDRIRCLEQEGDLWKGFSHRPRYEKGRGRPKKMASTSVHPQEAPQRYHLPDTREGITHKFIIDKVRCYVTVSTYEDGRPGEVFLQVDKKGSFERGMTDAWAIMFSVALQHGIPLQLIVNKFKHQKFVPMGVTQTKNRELRFADSIVDYVVRWMEIKFIHKEKVEELPPVEPKYEVTGESTELCLNEKNCWDNTRRQCQLPKGHDGGCNPFKS